MKNESKTILIVEDEEPLARTLDRKLSKVGYNTIIAGDGESAMKILRKGKIDLVLLDLILPIMDGFQVIANIKTEKIKTPIIIMSNLSQDKDIISIKKSGIEKYFIKAESSIQEIIDSVDNCIKKGVCSTKKNK